MVAQFYLFYHICICIVYYILLFFCQMRQIYIFHHKRRFRLGKCVAVHKLALKSSLSTDGFSHSCNGTINLSHILNISNIYQLHSINIVRELHTFYSTHSPTKMVFRLKYSCCDPTKSSHYNMGRLHLT